MQWILWITFSFPLSWAIIALSASFLSYHMCELTGWVFSAWKYQKNQSLLCPLRERIILHCSLSHTNLVSYCPGWPLSSFRDHCSCHILTGTGLWDLILWHCSCIAGSWHSALKAALHLGQFCSPCLPSSTAVSVQSPHLCCSWTFSGAQALLCSWAALLIGRNSSHHVLGFRKWYTWLPCITG